MFYVLNVYWLSCNNSCAETSRPFEHAENWFLKRRLDTNMCQVLIDVKYTRHLQLGLNKNLKDSIVKPLIFTTQKMKPFVKDLPNKCEQIRSFMQICSHLLNKFLTKDSCFVQWFAQVERILQWTWTIIFATLFTFLTARCLDERFWDLL